ncbi:MAG: TRAP transporter substrate-binding protein [Lysobacterales bacterium]
MSAWSGRRDRLVLWILLTLLLCSCNGSDNTTSDAQVVRVSSLAVPNTPWHDMWTRFGKRYTAQMPADTTLDLFITGQIGSEETALSNLRRGRLQISGFSLQGLATVVPELSVLIAPYLFESQAQADFVLDEYLTPIFRELLAEKNLQLLQWSEVGWFHIYGRKPILDPADAQGLSMRSSNALGSRMFGEAIGADLIPVTFSEVIPSLQTGLIESGQGGIGMFAIGGISREAKHFNLTRHALDTGLTVANLDWYTAQGPQGQHRVMRSLDETAESRRLIRAEIARIGKGFDDLGVTMHQPNDEQMARWKTLGLATHEQMVVQIGGRAAEVYGLIEEGKKTYSLMTNGIADDPPVEILEGQE